MTNKAAVDRIILGDNQFFGVNHLSEDKGRHTRERFKSVDEIKKMMYSAMDLGVKGVFLSTHPDIYEITNMMRRDSALKTGLTIYVNIPYIVKYISMANTMGIPNTIKFMLEGKTKFEKLKFVMSSIKNVITKDYMPLIHKLIDVELKPFYDLKIGSVLLHNTLCDLCLGYKLDSVIKDFDNYIRTRYAVTPGYGTLNLPSFIRLLERADIKNALVMSAVNKRGFFMNPGVKEYESTIANNTEHTILAMATLASGAIKPEEAYDYLSHIGIKHIVVGLSTQKHAEETFGMIKKFYSR